MNSRSAAAMLLGTLSIATLHALIPSHWLAFAVVGRAHRWPRRRTLGVVALAGTGHVLTTILIGLLLTGVGKRVLRSVPAAAEHAVTAVILIVLGIYFVLQPLFGRGHAHHGHGHGVGLGDDALLPIVERRGLSASGPTTIGALVLGMTLSPCMDLLPLYLAAESLPWIMLLAMSVIMATVTVGLMVGLVWLTLHGLERLNLGWLERNEHVAVGAILIGLGVLLFLL